MSKLALELSGLLASFDAEQITESEFTARFLVMSAKYSRKASRDQDGAPKPCRMGCAKKVKARTMSRIDRGECSVRM